MTKLDFINAMRLNRGGLKGTQTVADMEKIYAEGTEKFMWLMINTKKVGVCTGAEAVLTLTGPEQDDFVKRYYNHPGLQTKAIFDTIVNTILVERSL